MFKETIPDPPTTRVHFICLGNAYRSVMAEAYLKQYLESKHIDGIEVVSSGTIANERYAFTRPVAASTLKFLAAKGLKEYAKTDSDQLTPQRIRPDDITVCMNPTVRESGEQIVRFPAATYTWNITDADEGEPPAPLAGDERWLAHTERIYTQITEQVHVLMQRLTS